MWLAKHLSKSQVKFNILANTKQIKVAFITKKVVTDLEHLNNFVKMFPKPRNTNAAEALVIDRPALSRYLSGRTPVGPSLREKMRNAGYDFETGTLKRVISPLGESTGYATTLHGESSGNAETLYGRTDESQRKDLTGAEKQIIAVLERYGIHTVEQLEEWLDATDAAMDLAEIFGSLSKLQQLRQLKTLKQARK